MGSAKRGDRRIVFVITGLTTAQARAEEAEKLVNWAFRQFAQREVAKAGVKIAQADVWMGDQPNVGLTVADDVSLLIPTLGTSDGLDAQVVFDAPISAPITKGQQLGELVISMNGLPEVRLPLVADRNVALGGFSKRMSTAVEVLMQKIAPTPEIPAEPAS